MSRLNCGFIPHEIPASHVGDLDESPEDFMRRKKRHDNRCEYCKPLEMVCGAIIEPGEDKGERILDHFLTCPVLKDCLPIDSYGKRKLACGGAVPITLNEELNERNLIRHRARCKNCIRYLMACGAEVWKEDISRHIHECKVTKCFVVP